MQVIFWTILAGLAQTPALLAEQSRFMHMGRRFRHGGSNIDLNQLLLLLVACLLVAVAIWALSRFLIYCESRTYCSQRALFRELCRAHKLNWSSRRLLWQLVRWHRLACPAEVFVNPRRFDTQQLTGGLAARQHQITQLRDRVCGIDQDGN
jgi:hypothetical protein